MNTNNKTTRILGIAFLFQFVTSFVSGIWMKPAWYFPGDIQTTMSKIAENPWLLRVNILMDMLTALGVIFLGAVLYITLRRQNENIALTAMGFYFLEGAILASSRIASFELLRFSQEFASMGRPDYFLTLGNLALESMNYADDILLMFAFCVGGVMFYTLLIKSALIPAWLSLWGLLSLIPLLIGILASFFNIELPYILYLPYLPFEFVIAVWILIKGLPNGNMNFQTMK
jgi:hypothetical protein